MFYRALRAVCAVIAKVLFRPKVEGLENIPAGGGVILASNHLSVFDSILIPLVVPRQVNFLAKEEYFQGKSPYHRARTAFMRAIGQVPVQRGQARAGVAALEVASKVLSKGDVFGIYPEGTRSRDLRLHRGHTGVGQLALSNGVPVVPMAVIGTDRIQPPGQRFPRPARVTIRIGKALDFSRYDGMAGSPAIRRAVTDEIMYSIMELSGQEYVDVYHKLPDAA
ncbi:lysophospholipid acyltransferase family protein [Kibdelosporangium phytohabitans]|uniref:Acyl-phosphate glycerol 3-phosphate acyltransferase n=1 Tax=Kibdelosporangium phytohabitans TaxID=860235 RepID=A0A0N7F2S6_9PSEU|nr:lysophospholipid acyltransferase family protein [Kibdelosporangium phytohabitans]ALG06655.1 acyl-phosphate glycerol 3-phosphate acyltransferase [Kibdelosporangium phytohabitans]MBE1467867.1 1-acyl-sn-glycerol-3-phosphate acyltransferase [Kibdelosporangium phytohabitans]